MSSSTITTRPASRPSTVFDAPCFTMIAHSPSPATALILRTHACIGHCFACLASIVQVPVLTKSCEGVPAGDLVTSGQIIANGSSSAVSRAVPFAFGLFVIWSAPGRGL